MAALGPGILLASAAVGGSHLVASTQAGAFYGWQLVGLVLLANLMKYPFFRFGPQYTIETGKSLIEGYATLGRGYLWVFFILSALSSVISVAAVGLLTAVILANFLPNMQAQVPMMAAVVILGSWLLLFAGHYKALDGITKIIMISLTITTVAATFFAASKGMAAAPDFQQPNPWTLAALPFLVSLMGWMPAPIEFGAINSMWVKAKQRFQPSNLRDTLFDFNVGYITSAVLAVFFIALGALVQYGTGEEIPTSGNKYVPLLISMYGAAIGEWARPMIAFIAFMCMFGTTITAIDGYARACAEALRLTQSNNDNTTTIDSQQSSGRSLQLWLAGISAVSLVIILYMSGQLAGMLRFAMISAFLTAPFFAWLNFVLVSRSGNLSTGLRWLSWAGIIFLAGFALVFAANELYIMNAAK